MVKNILKKFYLLYALLDLCVTEKSFVPVLFIWIFLSTALSKVHNKAVLPCRLMERTQLQSPDSKYEDLHKNL